MPAQTPAIDRIKYLVLGGPYRSTPSTINCSPDKTELYSYGLCIAYKVPGTEYWNVRTEAIGTIVTPDGKKSPTADRHIRAAAIALPQKGNAHD